MSHQFTKHYSREEANALLPQIRLWLQQLEVLRASLRKHDTALNRDYVVLEQVLKG